MPVSTPAFKLRLGKFKPPAGLERLQSASDIRFVERALPSNLVPNRDIGIQLHGDLDDERFSYAVGIFNGAPDNSGSVDADRDENKEVAGRLFVQPFKKTSLEPLQGLGVGIAASRGNVVGTPSLPNPTTGYRTPAQQTFTYRTGTPPVAAVVADGILLRTSPRPIIAGVPSVSWENMFCPLRR